MGRPQKEASPGGRRRRRFLVLLAALHLFAAIAGIGAALVLSRDLPGVEHIDVLALPRVTVLLDRKGHPLHSFAEQRRLPVTLDRISPLFRDALLATEDPRFYHHIGIDVLAIGRAALRTIVTRRWGVQGGSTITQQLARDLFLHRQKTLKRKIQEAILALQIEKHYSKDEILTLYCNRVYFGHGRYGVEAAARYFFGKSAKDLTLPEAALLAGLPQRPEGLSPIRHPDRALRRRNHVLRRMVAEGKIDPATAARAMKAPLGVHPPRPRKPLGPYFVEEVRRWLLARFGEHDLYRGGLVVRTTLDPGLQRAAERAVAFGLDLYGRRHRAIPPGRPLPPGKDPATWSDPSWARPLERDDIVPALVLEAGRKRAVVRIGESRIALGAEAISWTGRSRLDRVLRPATVVPVRILDLDAGGRPTRVELASAPDVEAALVALDPATGEVRALVGGRDFQRSQFDRAMQARRQAGSAFKPFIFAAALEEGFLPNQRIRDVPTVFVGPGQPLPYQPENYERNYEGYVTLRHALEHSRNIPTIRLLDDLGYDPAIAMARRLGIAADLKPYPSLALGAFEVRLIDLVASYAAFVNGGVLVTPALVRDVHGPEGEEVFLHQPEAREVLAPEVAAEMVSLLEGVVLRGTGRRARVLGRPVGGKTGTTDRFTDAWFVGFTPSLAVGVWVGHDHNRTLGRGETGARAALPIWIRFLADGLRDTPVEEFPRPAGVRRALLDGRTGRRARRDIGCREIVLETFPLGREAREPCSRRQHLRLTLPYPLQVWPIDREGELQLPPGEAARLVTFAPGKVSLAEGGRLLRWNWGGRRGSIPLAGVDEAWTREYLEALPRWADLARARRQERERFLAEERKRRADLVAARGPEAVARLPDPEEMVPAELRDGLDGWPAEVRKVNRSGRILWPVEPVDP